MADHDDNDPIRIQRNIAIDFAVDAINRIVAAIESENNVIRGSDEFVKGACKAFQEAVRVAEDLASELRQMKSKRVE